MEALVDHRMLGVLPHDLLKRISSAVRMEQLNKAPIAQSSLFLDRAMEKHRDWLSLQDIPQVIVRTRAMKERSEVPRRGPIAGGPVLMSKSKSVSEDIFSMDGVSFSPPESSTIKKVLSKQTGWKQVAPVIKYDSSHCFIIEGTEKSF